MPVLIKTNKLSGLRPVFTDNLENYKRYIQIRKKFETSGKYSVFAEPKIDYFRGDAEWYTDYEGKLSTFSSFLATHPGIAKEELESSVKSEINKLFDECALYKETDAEYRSLFDTLKQCIEVPSEDDIYIAELPNGIQKYVLTNWGFIYDAFNATTGIIEKMKVMALFNLRLHFKFPDGRTATHEKIIADFNGQHQEFITDEKGEIIINRFPSGSSLAIHQTDHNGNKANAQQFPSVNGDELTIAITNIHVCDHHFLVTDENGKPLPEIPVVIRVNGIDSTLISGNDGKITLRNLPDQSAVECYYDVQNQTRLISSFRSDLTNVSHILKIPADWLLAPEVPKSGVCVFHFVDKKNNNLSDLKVMVSVEGEAPKAYTTDHEGRFNPEIPAHNSKLGLTSTVGKINWKKKIRFDSGLSYYKFVIRKKCRWWLWLIAGLILLLLLLAGIWAFKTCTRYNQIVNITKNITNTVEVTVLDDANNKALAGASVSFSTGVFSKQATTGTSGKLSFNMIPVPTRLTPWVVYVSKAGYGDERVQYNLAQNKITIRMKKIGDGGLVGKRGQFNVNLQWYSTDDMDLVITDPCGNMIYFKEKTKSCHNTTGELDVDANADEGNLTAKPQENIVFAKASPGEYSIYVVFYESRQKPSVSCKITIFVNGKKEEQFKTIEFDGNKDLVLIKKVTL